MNKIFLFAKHAKTSDDCDKLSRSVSYETLVGDTTTAGSTDKQAQCLSKGSADAPLDAVGTLTSQLCCSAKVVEKSLYRHSEPQAKNPEKTKTVIPDLIGHLSRIKKEVAEILGSRLPSCPRMTMLWLLHFAFAQFKMTTGRGSLKKIATSEPVALPRNDAPLLATSAFRLLAMTPITLVFAAVLAICMPSESWAKECNCGEVGHESDCCWEIDSNGVLHITAADGKSDVRMADYETIYEGDDDGFIQYSTAPWANSNATKAVVGDGIGYIGSNAFMSTGGRGAKAESINNATDLNLWDMDLKVNGITEVSGMNGVTEIGDKAFSGALVLTSVNMPNVETIGYGAFDTAASLKNIDLPKVKTVGKEAFYYAVSLEDVYMPNVNSIDEWGFGFAYALKSVYMPNVEDVDRYVFEDATNLSYIGIPVDEQGCRLGEDGKRIEEGSSTCVSIPGDYSGTNISSCGQPGGSCSICTDSSRAGYDATKSVYKPSGTLGTPGTCVASGSCGDGYTEVNGLCKKNSSSGSQVSEASCYANGQVYWNNACVDEYPFAKKHWTPAEAAQYLKDTDNEIIMTFKVNR